MTDRHEGEFANLDRDLISARLCGVPGCGRKFLALGLCGTHYARWKANGTLTVRQARWTQERAHKTALAAGVELLEPFTRIDNAIRFRCLKCGVEAVGTVHKLRYQTTGCWPCSRLAAGKMRRLPSTDVLNALDAARMDLVGEYVGARKPVEVRCRVCGTHSNVRVDNVRNGGTKCRTCATNALSEAFRLDPDEVNRRAELAGLELLEPFSSTHHRVKVRCLSCGYVSRRVLNWGKPSPGCVRCGHRPFRFDQPALLYLMRHDGLRAFKIGVTNEGKDRLGVHSSLGWTPVAMWPMPGGDAYACEQAVIAWWRAELQLPRHLTKAEMPQGGSTETVGTELISATDILAYIGRLELWTTEDLIRRGQEAAAPEGL